MSNVFQRILSRNFWSGRVFRSLSCFWRAGLAILYCTCAAFAQNGEEYSFRRISRLDGLSSDEIFSIYQDRRGIMWFGSADGLHSYDGVSFTVYRHKDGDSTSIPQNLISGITEDKSGNLWVGTKDYICRFVPSGEGGRFVSHLLPTRAGFYYVRCILDDGDSLLYLQFGGGVVSFNKRSFAVRSIFDEGALGADPKFGSTPVLDARGKLWIASEKGLFCYDTRNQQLHSSVFRNCIIGSMVKLDTEGLLWFADKQRIYAFDPQTERIQRSFPMPQLNEQPKIFEHANLVVFVEQSSDSLIWFQFQQVVWTLHPRTGEMVNRTAILLNTLNNSIIISGCTDRTGVLWLGDAIRGIAVWSPYKPKFRLWRHNPLNPKSISNDYIRGIWDDERGTAWVCTQYGGLNRIQLATGEIRHYRAQSRVSYWREEQTSLPAAKAQTGLKSDDLWGAIPASFDATGQRSLWIYKQAVYCQELNIATGRFRLLPMKPLITMFRDRDGVVWTADSAQGKEYIGIISADGNRFIRQKTMAKNASRVDAICHDQRNRIWFALYDPLILRFDKTHKTWDTLHLTPRPQNTDFFTSMTQDRHGNVWIATKGDGIYVCDTNDRTYSLTEKDGLPNNNVYGVFEDARGEIWISSDKGVVRYNPTTKSFRQYTPDDGLQGWEFNRMAFYQTSQGNIYFGGTNGLNLFHPDNVRDNLYPPPVVITSVKIFDKARAQSEQTLRLAHDDNTLSFEFAALDYTAPRLNKYSWKLDGFESEWQEPTSQHDAKYTNLPPGEYVFRVKACNSDGVWNEAGVSLPIVIEPAWYQTWQFLLLCALALFSGITSIVRWRVRAVERRNRLLEVEIHRRTRELREANGEIKRQMEIQDAQAREIELANGELDVTLRNLKSAQTQLVQSERMNAIGMLTAGVMHEINNPNAIAYSAVTQARAKLEEMTAYFFSLLDEESKTSSEAKKYRALADEALLRIELAANGAQRVKTIVANLQGMTKHQEEGGKVGNIITELAATFSLFQMQFHTVEIAVDAPASIVVRANFGEINQIFLNLLVNAAQAGATKIVMTAAQTPTTATLRMTDNGKGMSAETARRIFEPFFTTKDAGSSGLGLSISKQIIERHGGSIVCESELGKGATFIVELPKALE